MTGFVNLKEYEVNSVLESCTELKIDGEPYLSITTLYAAHTQALDDGVVLYTLRNGVIQW